MLHSSNIPGVLLKHHQQHYRHQLLPISITNTGVSKCSSSGAELCEFSVREPSKRRTHLFILRKVNKSPRQDTRDNNMTTRVATKKSTVGVEDSTSSVKLDHLIADKLMAKPLLVEVEFEVFGDVTGVFFTKYAREMCEKLKLRGWVRLSRRGTVIGQIQGEKDRVDEMALWLRLQGSPGARIEHCEFKNWQIIDSYDYRNFNVRF